MSDEKGDHVQPEQDKQGPGDDLPTYDDLAAQSGPNSRLDLMPITSKFSFFLPRLQDLVGGENG